MAKAPPPAPRKAKAGAKGAASQRAPKAAKAPAKAAGKPRSNPWPKINAISQSAAKPTRKRAAKATENARKAKDNRTDWI